jgi:hypothetical protein
MIERDNRVRDMELLHGYGLGQHDLAETRCFLSSLDVPRNPNVR